jgi:hypothetical protein
MRNNPLPSPAGPNTFSARFGALHWAVHFRKTGGLKLRSFSAVFAPAQMELARPAPDTHQPFPKGGEDRAFSVPMPSALRPLPEEFRRRKEKFTVDFPFQPRSRTFAFTACGSLALTDSGGLAFRARPRCGW